MYAGTWQGTAPRRRIQALPRMGRLLLLTGVVVALVGGALTGLGGEGALALTVRLIWLLGVALLGAGASWPGGVVAYAQPDYRWEKDRQGNLVQVATRGDGAVRTPQRRRTVLLWLLAIGALAALLRLWNLAELPMGCVANECSDGLRLVDGQPLLAASPDQLNLYERTARLWFAATGNGVLSLRLTAVLFGLLALPPVFGLAWRLAGLPAALLTAAVLALSPWAIWASRSAEPWTLTLCLVAGVLWLSLQGYAHANARWWALAGLGAGLLFVETPPLRPAIGAWGVALTALALLPGQRARGKWSGLWLPLTALAVASPWLAAGLRNGTLFYPIPTADWGANLATLVGALLRPDVGVGSPLADAGLLNGLTFALAVVGLGALARHLRQPPAVATLLGLALFLAAGAATDPLQLAPGSLLLALLPFLLASVAVAVQQIIAALIRSWAPLVRPAYLAGGAALLLVLVLSRSTVAFVGQLDGVQSAGISQTETAMARFIARWLAEHPGDQTTFVVPAGVADHPSLRLLAGAATAAGRVQPLAVARTLPFAGQPPGDLLYLLPVTESQTLDLLRQLYPASAAGSELDETGQQALFNTLRVPQDEVAARQALQLELINGDGSQQHLVQSLELPWAEQSPLPLPFAARIEGSLSAPAAGDYRFAIVNGAPDAAVTLQLDDLPVLDSSQGVNQQSIGLAQGIYRLGLDYRSGSLPADLNIHWQPPGAAALEPIPSSVLQFPPAPNQGLLGEYFANEGWQGAPALRQKDPVVGLPAPLPAPYSVIWHGKVAAPRSGEYRIGVNADGFTQIALNSQIVATVNAGAEPAATTAYAEGLIYLPAGWHELTVRHAPANPGARLRLLWQPAGSGPAELGGTNLLPVAAGMGPATAPLPSPAPLLDERLGADRFALSVVNEAWQPQTRLPPADLPPLPLTLQWQVGNGCGAGAQQFNAPHGLAFALDGSRIYVADTNNRRIQSLAVDGLWSDNWQSEQLQEPVDISVALDGAPLVLDALAQQVFRIEPSGALLPLPLSTAFYRPRGLDRDGNGNLLVADTGGGRVVMLAPDGTAVGEFGGRDTPLGRGQPVDALATGQALWTITAEDGRLWNNLTTGSFTAVLPTNTIDGPHLAALPDGRFLATDPGRGSFTLFDVTGEPLGQFGYPGQLRTPTGIAATQLGDALLIAVSDTAACTVSLWRLNE